MTSPLDVKSLIELIEAGWNPEYLMFWGHRAKADSAVGKHVLSQWWPASFTLAGIEYRSAEHFMMAEKARLFGDSETAERIIVSETPADAKSLGRQVRNFDPGRWDRAAFEIVTHGNVAKFGQNPDLAAYLLGSGEAVLVEASPVDAIWGIGAAADDPVATDPRQWRGTNLLGFALMAARSALRSGDA